MLHELDSREGCHLHLLYKMERALPERLMGLGEFTIHELREKMLHNLYDIESVQHAVDMTVQSGHLQRGLRLKGGVVVWGSQDVRAEARISGGFIFDSSGDRYSADDVEDVVYCLSNDVLVEARPDGEDKATRMTMFERVRAFFGGAR